MTTPPKYRQFLRGFNVPISSQPSGLELLTEVSSHLWLLTITRTTDQFTIQETPICLIEGQLHADNVESILDNYPEADEVRAYALAEKICLWQTPPKGNHTR